MARTTLLGAHCVALVGHQGEPRKKSLNIMSMLQGMSRIQGALWQVCGLAYSLGAEQGLRFMFGIAIIVDAVLTISLASSATWVQHARFCSSQKS